MAVMRLILTADDGTVLDSTDITREDWDNLSLTGAGLILKDLNPGTDAS